MILAGKTEQCRRNAAHLERREEFLAVFAPFMLISLIGLWVSVLIFGFGAVLLLAWRVFRQPSQHSPVTTPPSTQPLGV